MQNLKQYENNMMIIEGPQIEITNNEILHENALRGFFLSLIKFHKIPFLITESESDTAHYLALLARTKSSSSISLRPSRLPETRDEQLQFILEGFPGIGPTTAKALLSRFHSLKNIFNASEQELEEILGKRTKEFRELISR